ncbi:MAG: mandelate racemase/muconate lactonizing enzyme family protein [Nitrospinota bacterium]
MKIERIEAFPVSIPLNHTYKDANRIETHSRDVVVKISASGGAVGWGAGSPRTFPTGETQASAIKVLEEILLPLLGGKDPFELEAIHREMGAAIPFHFAPKSAIDCALYDLQGRVLDQPVYNLLGGKIRDEMPSFDILPLETPEITAEIASAARAEGTMAFKIKMNRDLKTSVARVRAVREAVGGEAMLVVDANTTWTSKLAISACSMIEEYDITMVEQPVSGHDIDGMEFITRNTRVRICADESMRPDYMAELMRRRAADVVNIKVNREGGLLPCKKAAAMAEMHGIEGLCGSVIQGVLIDAAAAHLFASTPGIIYNESGKAPAWHDLDIATGLRVENGMVKVPEGPGLGVEIDEKVLRKFLSAD